MKQVSIKKDLPPVVRVFLSSTFSDMQNERDYFNSVLVPKLNRLCVERGVSFFSVDLRWGITEEEQINGQVLPICLSEIDKCRPFFIGILGNRYGSVMEAVPPHITKTVPWLVGKEGYSITELEMLYAVLDQNINSYQKNCSFYLRSEALSSQWYGQEEEDPRLSKLKARIRSDESIPSREYADLETFGKLIEADMLQWLDREFPAPENPRKVRRDWYNRELLRNYIDLPQPRRFLDTYFSESNQSLLFYGDGGRGKTTFLTAWQPKSGNKILINCGSDDAFLYWPSIARQIISEINEIDDTAGFPDIEAGASFMFQMMQTFRDQKDNVPSRRLSTDFYFVTDHERESFRTAFLSWLEALSLKEPLYVIINDLNLLEDESSRMLSWLPSSARGNIRFVCSSNSAETVSNAQNLGWNCTEMPTLPGESCEAFVRGLLNIYGKTMSQTQLHTFLGTGDICYPGQLRFMVNFLIKSGRFENLDTLIQDLANQTDALGIYRYVFDFQVRFLTDREHKAVETVFGLLRCAQMSLNEAECFRLTAAGTGINAVEWARIRDTIEVFGLIKGDYWNMREAELHRFVDYLLPSHDLAAIQERLGDDMLKQLHTPKKDRGALESIREQTAFSKAVLYHYQHGQSMEKLHQALMNGNVLFYLSKLDWHTVRAAWVTLFLHSDTDLSSSLFSLLERYRGGKGDEKQIAMRVAGLFTDLEQRIHLPRVYACMGTDRIPGSLHPELEQISEQFASCYNSLHDLKKNRRFRELCLQAGGFLDAGAFDRPIERCQLLFFKADAEGHMKQYRQFLETSNAYYIEAIRASSVTDMLRALSLRGDALYRLHRYSDAEQVQRQVSRIALRDGQLRAYLAARNILAMCLSRNQKSAEAVGEYDALITYWQRLGDAREVGSVLMNKCNAYAFNEDYRSALETAQTALEQLPAELKDLRASIRGNMGAYAMHLGRYDEAESALLQTIEETRELGAIGADINARFVLVAIYRRTDRVMEAVEQYKVLLDLLWEVKAYDDLVAALQEAADLLMGNHYGAMARELKSHWEEKFSQMEGGKALFQQKTHFYTSDQQKVTQLKEQLAVAKSEGDSEKTAKTCYDIASALYYTDPDQALALLLESASLYRRCGQEKQADQSLEEALEVLFEKGHPRSPERYEQTLDQITDPAVRRIVYLWAQVGRLQLAQGDEKKKKAPLLRRLFGKDDKAPDIMSVPACLEELASYSATHETLIRQCLMDLTEIIIKDCSAEQIIQLVRGLEDACAKALTHQLNDEMPKNFQQDIYELTQDYRSPAAEKKLAYYEKCIKVLEAFNAVNVAAIAGNIAIIYRRRQEREKTIRCHTLSARIYKERGNLHDYLIELMNTATAHSQFDQKEKAISLLRSGIAEAAAAEEKRLEASMAGNLASLLCEKGGPAVHDEVMEYFGIEERYFREAQFSRDLAISLINQIIYLKQIPDCDEWVEKLREAGELIRSKHLDEFVKVLVRLEWQAQIIQGHGQCLSLADAKANIRQLLSATDLYEIHEFELEDDQYHAFCTPKEDSPLGSELMHLFLDQTAANRLDVIFLYQFQMVAPNAAADIKKYISWWNEQGEYPLLLHEEDMVLQASCRLQAASWEDVIRQFNRVQKLWDADKTNFGMLCIGLSDLPMYQGMKLRILNEDT